MGVQLIAEAVQTDPLTLSLARWQFAVTTLYHYIFVPITIGTSFMLAVLETLWVRTRDTRYLRAVKFIGKLFLINFAIGVVTGIVQEFQFGMNWSSYSRFVGDVFGAPLAMEALLAFFMESTFIGLWIFGWDKLSPKLHCLTIWMVAFGTALSGYFILAANSFMQYPKLGESIVIGPNGRPMLNSISAVLFNPLAVSTFFHVIMAAYATAACLLVGVASYWLSKGRYKVMMWKVARIGLIGLAASSALLIVAGDLLAKNMTIAQPMKMAAAEAQYETKNGASFSIITIGTLDGKHEVWAIRVPYVQSFMASGDPNGRVEGINDLKNRYAQEHAQKYPGKTADDYTPNIAANYWLFRLMMGPGFVLLALSVAGLWLTRGGRHITKPWMWKLGMFTTVLALFGNLAGWMFTEFGRQPWVVFGLFRTEEGVSWASSSFEVGTSLALFTLVYGALAVVAFRLFFKYLKLGPPSEAEAVASLRPQDRPGYDPDSPHKSDDDEDAPLAFAY